MKSAALLLVALAVLPGCKGPEQEETRTNAERIAALGLDRDPLPDADNPVLALKEPLETFLEETRDDFQTDAKLPNFLDFQVGAETRKRCWALQQTLRETIDRGPGRIPDPDPSGFNVYLLIQAQRANAALAATSLADKNPAGAAFHLALTFEIADYLLASDPLLLPYSFTVYLKKKTFDDLLALYQASPSRELLTHINTICRNSRFRTSRLESALKAEARCNLEICRDFPNYLKEQHKAYGALLFSFQKPPLSECTIEQILALPYDREASVSRSLDDAEDAIRWLHTGEPLSRGPERLLTPRTPKPLEYYQTAPNGLAEIFDDCGVGHPYLNALVTHQILEAHIDTSLAWLAAEADGVSVTSLEVLVPGYLDRIPADPCDGKPLRCIPEKRLIYSIGTDLKDNGGLSLFDPEAAEDDTVDRVLIVPEIEPQIDITMPPSLQFNQTSGLHPKKSLLRFRG
jgi:hypothetical protein